LRTHVQSGSEFEERYGFARALRAGRHVHVAGTAPIDPDGGCAEDAATQARRCFEIVLTALRDLGATEEHVVRTRMYLTDPADAEAVGAVHGAVFGDVRPAATMVVVSALIDPRWKIEVEAEAFLPEA
jgi:enamine deaminase RidA (YjgF/YER057c/UK114 family)